VATTVKQSDQPAVIMPTPKPKRGRSKKQAIPSKMCTKCREVKELNQFYGHKAWGAQSFCDAWCKACVQSHCCDMETLREYCWYNNRLWRDAHWEKASQAAVYKLSTDPAYIKAGKAKRQEMENLATCTQFYRLMNLQAYYSFSPNIHEESGYREFNPESVAGSVRLVDDDA
jgi:hypothetical protein